MSDAVRRVIFGGVIVAVLLAAVATPAAAHSGLEASSPADGGRIDAAPSQVLLRFTEPVVATGARVVVVGPDGRPYQSGAPQVSGDELTQPLKPLGPPGVYRVEFRIVANDGHPEVGGIRFSLTKPAAAAGPGTAAGSGPSAGGAEQVPPAPLTQVSSSTVNDAPSWAPWLELVAVVLLASGAVLFGRRVTCALD